MSTYTALEESIKLAEMATDADYHEKLDAIIAKAKAAKLQLDEDDETAKEFDEFEEPEAQESLRKVKTMPNKDIVKYLAEWVDRDGLTHWSINSYSRTTGHVTYPSDFMPNIKTK